MKKQNKPKQRSLRSKTDEQKEKFLEELAKVPVIQIACQRTGISRPTYYLWAKEDKEFKRLADKAIIEGISVVNDLAESKLINNIQQGNNTSIIFWLKHNNERFYPHRYSLDVQYSDFEVDNEYVMSFVKSLLFTYNQSPEEQERLIRKFLDSAEATDEQIKKAVIDAREKVYGDTKLDLYNKSVTMNDGIDENKTVKKGSVKKNGINVDNHLKIRGVKKHKDENGDR